MARSWPCALLLLLPKAKASVVPAGFAAQIRCPFAKVWLEHGPESAARMLGIAPHRRLDEAWGTCTYVNPFAGGETCMELRGPSWTSATAATRCGSAMPNVAGTLVQGAACQTQGRLAGWCSMAAGAEAMPMFLSASPAADTCGEVQTSCETWSSGSFAQAGECAPQGGGQQQSQPAAPGAAGPQLCAIAPGPMGAAHQLGASPGYATNCTGTPAEGSPYMWPLRWTAEIEAKSFPFGSDSVVYESRGRVWYMLDRNWKRQDTWYQHGVQRAVGQGPCESPVNGTVLSCNRSGSVNQTMLHRGNKMVFIDYAANGSISDCSWLDLSLIGNIRPDWFLDTRGASTDVQYIGDSHVYYLGEPRLVKQWRKKDFANQYFTMSVQRLPGPDGVHWPLILNVPGEGFGDDFLQHWHGHRPLGEAEASAFLLDEAHVAAGGSCPQRPSQGQGPPTGQAPHVPSNLEVDPVSWRTIVYTGSPVWSPAPAPPPAGGCGGQATAAVEVAQGVRAEPCLDGCSLSLTVKFTLSTAVWAAIGFLDTDECLMTPRGGGDGEVVYVQPDAQGTYTSYFGPLSPSLKHFQASALSTFVQNLTLLDNSAGFSGGSAQLSNGELTVSFARAYATRPQVFHLSFAYGNSPEIGYHASRGCFALANVATCPGALTTCQPGSSGNGSASASTTTTSPSPDDSFTAVGAAREHHPLALLLFVLSMAAVLNSVSAM